MRRQNTRELVEGIMRQQARNVLRERLEEYDSERYYICETDIRLVASEEGVSAAEVTGLLDQYARRCEGRGPYAVWRLLSVLQEE